MDTITVPYLDEADTVEHALELVFHHNVAAVVIENPDTLALCFIGTLGDAQANGAVGLAQIPKSELDQLGRPTSKAIAELNERGASPFSPGEPSPREEAYWGLVGNDFAASRSGPGTMTLISRTESRGDLVRHRFTCNGKARHMFPRPQVTSGQQCPRCVTLSGTPPTIT
jgi:hypothetical protein